ncbi:RrF2 family transcriptional regulator [Streptococcus massiliensis]|uniref:Transcriptional regulator n=1 Tax=Streptococcus massiliensis TaxID=313439 RepID=A0A380KVS4_9STRE|nr:Rrf2 family transcriptional regulator [Streptococcus massiliensis]SUN75838.1 transcriptional regulator [Streptococcus massiliensis]
MEFSKGSDYALHSLQYLIKHQDRHPIRVSEIAEYLDISPTYLSKILTSLTKSGYLSAGSGAKGGYSLIPNWEEISFYDVITAIEGDKHSLFDSFNHGSQCQIFKIFSNVEKEIETVLKKPTLKDLVR